MSDDGTALARGFDGNVTPMGYVDQEPLMLRDQYGVGHDKEDGGGH